MQRSRKSLALTVSVMTAVAGCASGTGPSDEGVSRIAVTTSILGSVVEQIVACVGDDTWQVDVLMPRGTDPHDFSPSSDQVARAVSAEVVVANGLGLEENLHEVLDQIEADGGVVWEVAEWANPLPFAYSAENHAEEPHDEEGDGSHGHGDEDPHFWLDASRMAMVASEFGARMAVDHGPVWAECGDDLSHDLNALDAEVAEILDSIPASQRVLITEHESFGYFAEHYGFSLGGAVIPGGGTLAQANVQDVQALVEVLRAQEVRAVFGSVSRGASPLLETLAEESGNEVDVVLLYVESLGEPGGEAGSYQDMMLTNARALSDALRG